MKYPNIREEELKNKIAQDYFWLYDCTKIIGNVDFCVSMHQSQDELFAQESLLWAEAKKGASDIYKSIVQLILTIGKARTFDKTLPPAFLGAFDSEKMAFIPYNDIHEVFYINDFNWNVAPSNHESKEFKLIHEKVKTVIDSKTLLFYFLQDDKDLKRFIKDNFIVGKFGLTKTKIDKNNFMVIYNKWLQIVKPSIALKWEKAKEIGLIDGDFYLADLLSMENVSLKEKLYIFLKKDHYEMDRGVNELGLQVIASVYFKDKQVTHTQFWNKYERPPKEEYWDYIVARRDLLVPQDVRERKGSFFTPQIWVELSQKYLTDVLGEDWQDEYYIWDCAAGTGNLLTGLTNKHNIFASTLDQQDVEVMKDRIKNGANLIEDHVFQFDFLNDDFKKLPKKLQEIINSPEKRKKLVMYINPPYAESNGRVSIKRSAVQATKMHTKYFPKMEKVAAELYAQFLMRIYMEIPNCYIGHFSTLKVISASNSQVFRNHFLAQLTKLFVVPADTFDNVKGSFPIGFFIWNTQIKEKFEQIEADVFNADGLFTEKKHFYSYDNEKGKINDFLNQFKAKENGFVGVLVADAPDFQNNNFVCIQNLKGERHGKYFLTNQSNLITACIYFSVRHCIEATWLNDRDQFLYPNEAWQTDTEFQNDCLAFTLFHGQNKITSSNGINHWIPFTEQEVNARSRFDSNFMSQFIKGKLKTNGNGSFLTPEKVRTTPLEFSTEAKAVFEAGKKLWTYYHTYDFKQFYYDDILGTYNSDVSLYDIKEYFQGRNDKGKMNNKSTDETYNQLIGELREKLKALAEKIAPKVYEYGFLKP